MKTLVAKHTPYQERKWFIVDAEGQTLGRLATRVARTLSGRDRVDYTPHIDNGAYVIIINAEKIQVTGKKETAKLYHSHSGFMGGLKEIPLDKMRILKPTFIVEHAIAGMLPKNRLQNGMLKRLRVVAGPDHVYSAQNPEILTF